MAEDIRDVSTISDGHQDNNATTCADEIDTVSENIFDGLDSELVSWFVPDALFKLFSTETTSSTAVENERTDGRAVSTMDAHGLQEVAGILHQSITTLDQWFYGTPAGRELQRTFLEEFPELRDPVRVGLRNLLHVLTPVLTQLQNRSHPHFQDIERWFSTYHVLVKAAVNFLHGGVVRLMKRDAGEVNRSLDVSGIINELASIRLITDIGKHLCGTQEGLATLTEFFRQIPEPVRPDERAFRNLLQNLPVIVNQMKDTSNPLVQAIEQWFANSNVLIRLALNFLHGAVMGLINNEACKGFGPLDVTQIFVEMKKALHQVKTSWGQWLFETPNGQVILKTIFMELLGPMRPVDNGYRNNLQLMGNCLIQLKNSSDPLFQSLERKLAEDQELLTLFVMAFHITLVWSINTGSEITLLCIRVLQILNEINEKNGYPVARRMLWLQGLESSPHLRRDLLQYAQNITSESKAFTWLDVPFLLNVRTKWKFVSLEAVLIMERDMKKADRENTIRRRINKTIYAKWYPKARLPIIPTCLQFHVERDNIVQSAIKNVDKYWGYSDSDSIWLKPLEVNFEGESAVDFGGPSKDFFHRLFSALLDPEIHIFRKIDDQAVSSDVWFNPEYLDYSTLEKIGLLFALLIFNGAVTTVPFPEQLYEKLLSNRDPEASDLEKIDQEFVKQLFKLREMGAEDVEALDLDFEELRPGDENIPVTKENLELYIKEMMTKRLAIPQLAAFTKGFNRIASMTPLMKNIFKAEDLRDVILGEELDWNAFKLSAVYQFPYYADHPVIKMFWKVFDEFEENDKRQFLKFLTGADHVPVGGFVRFPVRRLNNMADKYRDPVVPNKFPDPGTLMPEVMTCRGFLSMDLPEYKTEEDLRFRLKMAIQTSGFHREAPHRSSATAPCSESPMLRQVVQVGVQLLLGGRR